MAVETEFIDTNILVYASKRSADFHASAVHHLEHARRDRRPLWISRQILREYLATVTRPQGAQAPLSMRQALLDIESFEQEFSIAEDGIMVFENLRNLLVSIPVGGKQVHDANIVATMLAYGIPRLATFNTADFRRFGSVVEIICP